MARTKQTARVGNNAAPAGGGTKAQKALTQGPMQSTLKHLDYKCTEKGHWFYADTKEDKDIPEQINWWDMYALCLVRQFSGKFVTRTDLRINSPHLKSILKEVVGSFPGISFDTKNITVQGPYRVLFHYRTDLKEKLSTLNEEDDAAKHLTLLIDFIEDTFADDIEESDNLREQGLITYDLAWTIMRPGLTLIASILGQPRAFKLLSYQYVCGQCPHLALEAEFFDYDGEKFGSRQRTLAIYPFSGTQAINSFQVYPLEFHDDMASITARLIARGRHFESLAGMNFQHYEGIAITKQGRFSHDGRVVVDTATFHRIKPDHAFEVSGSGKSSNGAQSGRGNKRQRGADDLDVSTAATPLKQDPLTDDQCMLANAMVRGFSFTEKQWYEFFVDNLRDIDWNPRCFDQLVLPDVQKDTVKALVSTHIQNRLDFDDIVQGKGQGLVLVLHGPPGVGKTLTAETVAEFCKRPLYSVSSGDLGTDSSTLDSRLGQILDLASTWKAVLLIDEADVFLERRSLHDMERNALVSIFLRVLEWYKGILFLTSNRVNTFDDAFKSRIHVPLKYSDLTVDSRKQVWKNFLLNYSGNVAVSETEYEQLAQAQLNGRQIKNVIRTAKSLGQFHNQKLDAAKLLQVVEIQNEFEQDLASMNNRGAMTPESN